jgi:elongation factor G
MPPYSTHDIRNIALAGHGGAGKTTLAEALLARAGLISAQGSVEKGDTVSDYDPQEHTHGHSLDPAFLHVTTQGKMIHLVDTPGYPDFIGRATSVLAAVETVAIVISAHNGIEPISQRMMEAAARHGLDRIIVVNMIDAEGVDLPRLMGELRETFGSECLPVNLPAEGAQRVVDCFFAPDYAAKVDFSSVREAHDAMVDQVVEVDEELMELYLEQGQNLSPDQLHEPYEKALREGHLIPVCFASAHTGAGLDELLEFIVRLAPDPTEGNPPPFLKGEGPAAKPVEVTPDAGRHAIAHVVKISNDPYRGKLSVFRVHQGTITPNSQLYIGDARKPFKVNHLYRLQGSAQTEMARGIPGDICAVAKIDDLHFDAVIHDSHDEDHFHLHSIECPAPMHGVAIKPARHGDEHKLSDALHKLNDEDPCLLIEHERQETVLRGLGELHLRVVLDRLRERYNVEVETHPPTVPYRESITRGAEGHHRHKKQTGGAGQFGEVYLRIEPLTRGSGFEFVDAVVGGAIPGQFIAAVEKGVREAMAEGVIAGFPMHDVRVTVYDGKTHPVDGKEVAFVSAGKKAMQEASLAAAPVVLEPIVEVQITAPAAAVGDITGDLAARRGRISGTDQRPDGRVTIAAQVPLAELGSYESKLKAITGGEGTFAMDFSHYDPVPANIQKGLEAEFQRPSEG